MMNYRKLNQLLISILLLLSFKASAQEVSYLTLNKQYPNYLIFTLPNRFGELDPVLSENAQTKLLLPLIFESLVTVNAHQELEPVLAKSWKVYQNKYMDFDINKGHYFSDNSEVTANDVINSINRLCSKESQSSGELQGLVGCSKYSPEIKAIGRYQVRFQIDEQPSVFLYELSSPRSVVTKKNDNRFLGSGSYQILINNKDYIILKQNDFYHDKKKVKNSGLILEYLNEDKLDDFLNIIKPDASILYQIKNTQKKLNDGGYKIINDPPYITQILVLNNNRFPFNNKILRTALFSALYNQNKIYQCHFGATKAYGVIPQGIGGSLASIMPRNMPEVSPEIVFKQIPSLKNHKKNIYIHQHIGRKNSCEAQSLIDAAKSYNALEYFTPSSKENFINSDDSNLNKLFFSALSKKSSHERYEAYRAMDKYMIDQAVVIPYYYLGSRNFVSKCLGGITSDFYFNPYMSLPNVNRINGCNK
jgi:ABC-type transport system substrate-binding protein